MQTCTNCGTPYDGYACPRCGTLSGQNHTAAQPSYYQGNQPAPTQNRICLGCGVQIPANFNNCPHCGRQVEHAPQQPQGQYAQPPQGQYPSTYPAPVYAPVPPAPPKSGHGKVLIVVVVVVVLVIAAIAAAILFMAVANPFGDAKVIFDGDIIEGEMSGSGVDDLYKITLAPGEVLKTTLSGAGGTDFDLYAYENVQFWDEYIITGSATETSSEDMNFVAWEDNYYIIDVYSYLGSGDYTLTVDVVETVSLDDGDNSISDASDIASGATVVDELNEYYDLDDYYKILLNEGQILYATLEVPVQVNTDFDLYLYDADGNQLDVSEAAYGNEMASAYAQETGFYYVNAWAYNGIGTYSLYVEIQTGTGTDSNNDISSAEALVGNYASGSVNEYNDPDDFFSISLNAGETFTATMNGPTDADFDLYLYNGNDEIVASSQEIASYEIITYTAPVSGTYYINPHAYTGFGAYYIDTSSGGSGTTLNAVAGNDRTIVAGQSVTFDGTDSTGSITSYSWAFGDGETATGSTASHTFASTGSYTATLTVSSGANTDTDSVTITVVDEGSMPNKYAVVVGISDYQSDGNDLNFCDDDARSWTSYLEAQGYTVHTLIDDQASRSEILDEISWLEGQEQAGDYVAFVYSGHGSTSDRTRSSSICPWNDEEQGFMISDAELGSAFENFDSQHIFIFFDSCFSGGMDSVAGQGRYVSETAADDEVGLDASKFERGMWTYWFLEYAVKLNGITDLTQAYEMAAPRATAEAAASDTSMHPEEEFSGTSFYL